MIEPFGTLGPFLRQLRRSRRVSQSELAAVVGTDQAVVSAYENDRRVPSAEMLNRLVVGCGYRLVATDDRGRHIPAPLPHVGWFPDEDLPQPDPADPPAEPPTVGASATPREREAVLRAVLDTAVAVMEARRRT